jgi:hypothetical protein
MQYGTLQTQKHLLLTLGIVNSKSCICSLNFVWDQRSAHYGPLVKCGQHLFLDNPRLHFTLLKDYKHFCDM